MISVYVSLGEVIDKISILEIKKNKLTSQISIENVTKELDILHQSLKENDLGYVLNSEFFGDLVKVNSSLWDVEDELRRLESVGEFGDTFVKLARSVYELNDHRAALKRKVNTELGSGLIEEKSYQPY